MSKNLVIVESPHKAKTIEKFLGKDFRVLSSEGHIRDIEGIGRNHIGIDFDKGYQPHYAIDPKKRRLIDILRSETAKSDIVWLASDEDREGEAIAWHLAEVLNLKDKDTRRIVFHEITKPAILNAIESPRDIDYNLVNAQQARRVIDRIVGFELSPVLWKKITTGLSAGRVQSVAVRLIVEREREIESFVHTSSFRVTADMQIPDSADVLHCELSHRFDTKSDALAFLEKCKSAVFKVADVQTKPSYRNPSSPFTTSLLQQEAARKFKFPVSKTMRLAQALYEAGHITYMRTDSLNLSSLAIASCKNEITELYGERYSYPRQYHTNTKGAQEAHEAIRPTYMSHHKAGATKDEQRLYDLIWKRTIASQMAAAEVELTKIEVESTAFDSKFNATGEVVLFDGFMRVYTQETDNTDDEAVNSMLPKVVLGSGLSYMEVSALQVWSKPPVRYSEATLVKKMEELGIGRPSTYATTIETIQSRSYIQKGNIAGEKKEFELLTLKNGHIATKKGHETIGADSMKLLPTDLGRMANDFLVEQFPEILSYDFTASEEANFDQIAEGKADWVQVVDTFYKTFHPMLAKVPTGKIVTRKIGITPDAGEPVFAKMSKLGPCIQIGDSSDEKPRFASLRKDQSLFTITLEEALELFKHILPIVLGESDGKQVVVGEGKYGPYVKCGNTFVSIPSSKDSVSLTLDEAVDMLRKKQDMSLPVQDFGDIQVFNGRFGAYIKANGSNYKLPKNINPSMITIEECRKIIETTPATAKRRKKQ